MSEGRVANNSAQYSHQRRDYWEKSQPGLRRWEWVRRGYQRRLRQIYSFMIPPGMRVLELGCGSGDLLASVKPARGVGVDFSAAALEQARQRHPELHFIPADVHDLALDEQFDFIICADLINDLWDVQRVFEVARHHAHAGTKLVLNVYSNLWQIPRRAAESTGLARRLMLQNWLTTGDARNLIEFHETSPRHEVRCGPPSRRRS